MITSCLKTFVETIVTKNNSICMEQTSFITSKYETQSGKDFAQSTCRILHALRKPSRKRARKTSIVQADSRSRSTQARSDTCHELLVVFGLSTLNSNRTNNKPRKKLANRKRRYVLATLRDSNTILCTNSQTLYTEGLERLRRRQLRKLRRQREPKKEPEIG